ncbi:MAG: DUF362 domain-containing protein [Clostridiaceae bacterium]|jgi:uncharacterized protein (DUF362 family)/NAD-dependent dihydropyrimidine dehydrogenase PreA subunit|nr:DUF362 domain-containing protein [Clostridiaceae bacterium]
MDVIINTSENYRLDRLEACLEEIFSEMGGLEKFVKPGMKVAIKPNLLMAKKPEDAATTHPNIVHVIVKLVQKAGGIVSIVESPGGPYNIPLLKKVYSKTGMEEVADITGAELNFDLRVNKVDNPEALYLKSIQILKPLCEADLIINVAKLKTHGLMVYTGAVKNMFGSIAGLEKSDYHLRMSDNTRFAECLIDIFLATKPSLNIIDAIIGMEGDGPSAGVPKYIGGILASTDAFACDYAALKIIGVDYRKVPVLKLAEERGLFDKEKVNICGADISKLQPDSFDVPAIAREKKTNSLLSFGKFIKKSIHPLPVVTEEYCIGCGKCVVVCPPKAAKIDNNTMIIDYKKCISCFCCHEFCPEKAISIKRNLLGRLLRYRRV